MRKQEWNREYRAEKGLFMDMNAKNKAQSIQKITDLPQQLAAFSQVGGLDNLNFLQSLLDAIPAPIFYKDVEGVYRGCNTAFAESVLGLSKSQIIGKTAHNLPAVISPENAGIYHERDLALLREPGVRNYEDRIIFADGSEHHIAFSKATLMDAKNQAVGMVCVMLDVTLRHRAEVQRLELLEQTQRALSEAEALYQISNATTTAFENLGALLDATARRVAELLPADNVFFVIFNTEMAQITHAAHWGNLTAPPASYDELWQGVYRFVLSERHSVLLSASQAGPHEDEAAYQQRLAQNVGSTLVVPLRYRTMIFGLVVACNRVEGTVFIQRDIELLNAMATQAATVVYTARIFDELQRRADQMAAAATVADAASSMLDLDELLAKVVDVIKVQFTLYYVGIFLVDRERNWVALRAGTGEPGRIMLERNHGFAIGPGSMIGQCVALRVPQLPERIEDAERYVNPILPDSTAEIALPLISRGQVIGAMSVQSAMIRAFSDEDITVLQTMAGQIANALQNARFFVESQTALAETQALYKISRVVNEAQSPADLALALADVAEILELDTVSIRLFTHWDETYTPLAMDAYVVSLVAGAWQLQHIEQMDFDPELVAWASREPREILFFVDIEDPAIELPHPVRASLQQRGGRSMIFATLMAGERLLGQLTWSGQEPVQALTEKRVAVLIRTVVDQVGGALYTRYLLAQNEQRAQRLQTAAEVSRAASSIVDQDTLLFQTVELIKERFALYYVGIFLLDDSKRWAVLRAGTGQAGRDMLDQGHRLEVGQASMIGTSVATGAAVIRLDVGAAAGRFNNPHLPKTRSEMALPLTSRSVVIGSMTIQSSEIAAYSKSDITILQTMADQLANAIVNARVIAESEARYEEVQRLQSQYAVEMVDEYVAQQGMLGYKYDLDRVLPLDVEEESLLLTMPDAWTGRETLVMPSSGSDGAALLSPLAIKGQSVGVLQFEDVGQSAPWSEDDTAVLDAVRVQIALALENRLLLERSHNALRETRRREKQVRFLQEVVAFLNATESVVRALDDFLGHLSMLFPLDWIMLTRYDAREEISTVLGVGTTLSNVAHQWNGRVLPAESGVSWAASNNDSWIVSDLYNAQRFSEDTELLALGLTAQVIMPLRLGYRTLGALHLASHEPDAFAEADLLPIFDQLAAQVASAMERANLLYQAQDSADESRRLYEATSTLGKATSYATLLRAIIEHTILGEPVRAEIQLFVPDPESGSTHDWVEKVAAWSNNPALALDEMGVRTHISELPILQWVKDEVFSASDITQDSRLDEALRKYYAAAGVRAIVVGQFLIGGVASGKKIGFFQFHFSEPFVLTEQDLRLYNTILVQAAVVISNMQLLARSVNQTSQLSSAVDLANVTTALSDREQLLQDAVNFVKDRFDLYFVGIYLSDSDGQWLVLEAGTGQEGVQLMRMGHRTRINAESIEGGVALHEQRHVVHDWVKDELYVDNLLLPDTQSLIVLPLISRGQLIGVLSIHSRQRFAFTQEEITTLELMTTQLANVIESANLYDHSQSSLAETQMLYRISQQITNAGTIMDVLRAAVAGLSQRDEPDWISAALLSPIEAPTELRLSINWNRNNPEEPVRVLSLAKLRLFMNLLETDGRFVTPNITREPIVGKYLSEFFGGLSLRAMAAYPLAVRETRYGVLLVHSQKSREFSTAELRFYESVARQISIALQNISLIETTREEAERRDFLNRVLQTATTELEPRALLRSVGQEIASELALPVIMWRWDGRSASPVAVLNDGGELLDKDREVANFLPGDIPGIYQVIEGQEAAYIDFQGRQDSWTLRFTAGLSEPLIEAYAVRLAVREVVYGVLLVGRHADGKALDEQVRELVDTIGINISVALETAALYQEAQRTADQLKEVDRLKSEFLANMSHELRTPLNSIIGFSRVILKGIDGPLTDMQQTDLTAIYESGTQLLNLINDILDISKIDAGKMEFNFELTNLKELIKSVMLVSRALVKDTGVKLLTDVPDELPSVSADTRRIRQVLTNLLSNAAKFTEDGYIKVAATHDNYQVIVTVADTGIGIPPERINAVFERFEQVDSSSTRSYGGTGIGMPLSLQFVKAHGGELWLDSTVGRGTTFFFSLPIERPPEPVATLDEDEEERPHNPTSRIVLAVDDDLDIITIFRRYLEKQGYIVFGLTDGSRVVEEARRLHPYAITLDVLMPDKDGWQIMQELQADPETRDMPVIVCSVKEDDMEKGFSMGVSDYLVKPVDGQDLLDALTRLDQLREEGYILVVDDNPDDRKLLQRVLSSAGYDVQEASGGADAIARIHLEPPALIVLDLMMPDVDGFAVLEDLKAHSSTRRIPVVVVTAKELTTDEHTLLQQRVETLLQKGMYDQEQLLNDVSGALDAIEMKRGRLEARRQRGI